MASARRAHSDGLVTAKDRPVRASVLHAMAQVRLVTASGRRGMGKGRPGEKGTGLVLREKETARRAKVLGRVHPAKETARRETARRVREIGLGEKGNARVRPAKETAHHGKQIVRVHHAKEIARREIGRPVKETVREAKTTGLVLREKESGRPAKATAHARNAPTDRRDPSRTFLRNDDFLRES